LAVAGLLALTLLLLAPALAWTALVRLAHPFGSRDWPRQTQLDVAGRARVARGEPYEIQVALRGVIPPQAAVEYRFDAGAPLEQLYDIKRAEGATQAAFVARLEAGRVQTDFRFRVRAHDAESHWQPVVVLPPPQLVPLDG